MATMTSPDDRPVGSAHGSARLPSLPVVDGRSMIEDLGDRSDASSERLPVVEIKPFMHQEWRPSRSLPDYYDRSMAAHCNSAPRLRDNTFIDPVALGVSNSKGSEFGSRESLAGRPNHTPRFKPKDAKQIDISHPGIFATYIDREKTTIEEIKTGPTGPVGLTGVQRSLSDIDLAKVQDIKVQGLKMENLPPKLNMFYLTPWEYYRLHRSYHIPNGSPIPGLQNNAQAVVDEFNMRYGGALENVYLDDSIYDTFDRSNTLPSIRVTNAPAKRKKTQKKSQDPGSALSRSLPGSSKSPVYKLGVANSLDVLRHVGRPAHVETHLSSHLKHTLDHVRRTRDPQSVLGPFIPSTFPRAAGLRCEGAPTLGENMIRQGLDANNPKKSPNHIPPRPAPDGFSRPLYRMIHETYGLDPPNGQTNQPRTDRKINERYNEAAPLETSRKTPMSMTSGKQEGLFSAPVEDGNDQRSRVARTPHSSPLEGQRRTSVDFVNTSNGDLLSGEPITTSRASRKSREGRASRRAQSRENEDSSYSREEKKAIGGGVLKRKRTAPENASSLDDEDQRVSGPATGRVSGSGHSQSGGPSADGPSEDRAANRLSGDRATSQMEHDGQKLFEEDPEDRGAKDQEETSRREHQGTPSSHIHRASSEVEGAGAAGMSETGADQNESMDTEGAIQANTTVEGQQKSGSLSMQESASAGEAQLDAEEPNGSKVLSDNAIDAAGEITSIGQNTTSNVQADSSGSPSSAEGIEKAVSRSGDEGRQPQLEDDATEKSSSNQNVTSVETDQEQTLNGDETHERADRNDEPIQNTPGDDMGGEAGGVHQGSNGSVGVSVINGPSSEQADNNINTKQENDESGTVTGDSNNNVDTNGIAGLGETGDLDPAEQLLLNGEGVPGTPSPGRKSKLIEEEVKGRLPPSATTRKDMSKSAASKASSYTGDAVYITNWDQKTETESIMRPETVLTIGEVPIEIEDEE